MDQPPFQRLDSGWSREPAAQAGGGPQGPAPRPRCGPRLRPAEDPTVLRRPSRPPGHARQQARRRSRGSDPWTT
eukprot:15443402-Alexandrium_andersonii.AAC.1